MGFFQNPHCNRPFNSRLNRARVIYGVYRKKTLYPTQAAHPGVLANPPTLGAVGLGQTVVEQRKEPREKGEGGGLWQQGLPAPLKPSSVLPPSQTSWPSPVGSPWESLPWGLAPPSCQGLQVAQLRFTVPSLGRFIWLAHRRGL